MPVPPDWSQRLKQFVDEWKQNSGAEQYIGDAPFSNFVLTERAASWADFLAWLRELQGSWCFRGQRRAEWWLRTTLDRLVRREYKGGYYHLNREIEQRELLFRFKQQARLYVRNFPSDDDLGSWFALMQHHGAPTRLLDWTKSPYVAAYFAFEERAREDEKRSAVWAIDLDWLERTARKLLLPETTMSISDNSALRAEWVNNLLAQSNEAVIIRVDPLEANQRMASQQGVLLCKLLATASFGQTLMRMMVQSEIPDQPVVRRLKIRKDLRIDFLTKMKEMNIHRASLFPGLDGFAQSLRLDLEIKLRGEAGGVATIISEDSDRPTRTGERSQKLFG